MLSFKAVAPARPFRSRAPLHRLNSTKPIKPFLVTTPIFYPTASPHIGHLYTLVLADILKRWQQLCGREAILNTGTDEHGKKVWLAAEKLGVPVKDFCAEQSELFRALAHQVDARYDNFVRTTDPDHRFAVQHFWMMLERKGLIYQAKYEGWYSVSDEAFYPASAVYHALDPATGRKFMASKETGKEVNWISEVNYHFRLSAFRDRLLEHYRNNQTFVVPDTRMSDVYRQVVAGLDDLSVSRPADRIKWGIPVPGDESQTIYVWLDALINYLTKTGYPFSTPTAEQSAGWPADVQVVGKDIVRFHCIYWPAFLLALDLPLPRQILTHAHWTLGGAKMAKSSGNVVDPFFALDRFGVDPLRYYMAHDGGLRDDASYDNLLVTAKYKKGLYGGLGNLATRVLNHTGWSVRDAVAGKADWSTSARLDGTKEHREALRALPSQVTKAFDALDPGAALRAIMEVVYRTNVYIQDQAPWSHELKRDRTKQSEVIYHCAETLRICGILLQPYMPTKAARLLDMLAVGPARRGFGNTALDSDAEYGPSEPPTRKDPRKKDYQHVLFPPLPVDMEKV